MSDLQLGLVTLGAVLILLVVVFNWWQDRRVRRKMQASLPETKADPLMTQLESERKEPTVRIAETLSEKKSEPAVLAEDVDPNTEAVIDIHFAQAVTGPTLMDLLRIYLRVDTKPVRLLAISEQGEHHAYPHENERYTVMQLVVLLANRSGPLTEIDWSRLWSAAESIAQQTDGTVDGPEQAEVTAQAQQLDALCAGLDAQVSISLLLAEPTSLNTAQEVATQAGFMEYGQHLAWLASSGLPRFNLLFNGNPALALQSATVERLDLLIDLPNSPSDEQAFSRMACVGRDLALRLGGELVDDQGQPLTEHFDEQIDQQLDDIYQQLEQAGFDAASTHTQRVFS